MITNTPNTPSPLMTVLTGPRGTGLLPNVDHTEPVEGSIVLTEGLTGTAWQRHHSDGMWHSSRGGRPRRWIELLTRPWLVVVFVAPSREVD